MDNNFVITPKDEVSTQISIRIEKRICESFEIGKKKRKIAQPTDKSGSWFRAEKHKAC